MLKYLSKFAMDILPSVAATIIGAYIVNHYIATSRQPTRRPRLSSVDARKADPEGRCRRPPRVSTDLGNIPEAGVTAKGISEKCDDREIGCRKSRRRESRREACREVRAEAGRDRQPSASRAAPPAPREKTAAEARRQRRSNRAVAPVVAAPAAPPAVEAAIAPDEHRDANDLARAAIERLRGVSEGAPRAQEAPRAPEPPRAAARSAGAARCLGAGGSAAAAADHGFHAAGETFDSMTGSVPATPPYAARRRPTIRAARCRRPIFPTPRPLDLRADAGEPPPRRTPRLPKTCCRRRNRCFTRSCRNSRYRRQSGAGVFKRVLAGLAADARQAASRGLIRGPQVDGAAVGTGGLGLVAEPLIGKPAGEPDLRVLRIGLHGLVEVGRGFLRLVQCEIADRAREQRPGLLRLRPFAAVKSSIAS